MDWKTWFGGRKEFFTSIADRFGCSENFEKAVFKTARELTYCGMKVDLDPEVSKSFKLNNKKHTFGTDKEGFGREELHDLYTPEITSDEQPGAIMEILFRRVFGAKMPAEPEVLEATDAKSARDEIARLLQASGPVEVRRQKRIDRSMAAVGPENVIVKTTSVSSSSSTTSTSVKEEILQRTAAEQ